MWFYGRPWLACQPFCFSRFLVLCLLLGLGALDLCFLSLHRCAPLLLYPPSSSVSQSLTWIAVVLDLTHFVTVTKNVQGFAAVLETETAFANMLVPVGKFKAINIKNIVVEGHIAVIEHEITMVVRGRFCLFIYCYFCFIWLGSHLDSPPPQ